ncbi:hypothetical protein [Methylomonas sp. MgM2]
MKYVYVYLWSCVLGMPFSVSAHADSLSEISKFSKEICNDIQTSGNRTIKKTDIEAKLQGNIGKVAKYIGLDIGADGQLTIGDTKEEYDGLPYEDISEQMSDSRSCKLQLSKMLINERKKVTERLDDRQLSSHESEIKELSNEYQNLRAKFIALANDNKEIDNARNLPQGIFNRDNYGQHIKGKLETMGGQMQSVLLMISFMPTLKEITEGTKNISRSLEHASGQNISQSDEYRSIKNASDELNQRSQAILFEMMDLAQKRVR